MTRNAGAKRFGLFLIVIWGAASLNIILPRLDPGDPVRVRLLEAYLRVIDRSKPFP